jgi:hypothetical protein
MPIRSARVRSTRSSELRDVAQTLLTRSGMRSHVGWLLLVVAAACGGAVATVGSEGSSGGGRGRGASSNSGSSGATSDGSSKNDRPPAPSAAAAPPACAIGAPCTTVDDHCPDPQKGFCGAAADLTCDKTLHWDRPATSCTIGLGCHIPDGGSCGQGQYCMCLESGIDCWDDPPCH